MVPGVTAANRRNSGEPSGYRPIETPFCWFSKASAWTTRVRFELTRTICSPVEESAKPVWPAPAFVLAVKEMKPRAEVIVPEYKQVVDF